jgi:hypothetical protein
MESSQLGAWRSLVVAANLNQAASTYDLCTATGDVVVDPGASSFYEDVAAAAPLTSVAIQTNSTTANILMTTTEGAVGNLVAQASLKPANTHPFILRSGKKIQYVIAGGAGGAGAQMTVEVRYRPLGAGSGVIA